MWFEKKKKKDELTSGALKRLEKLKRQHFTKVSIEELNRIFRIYIKEKYKLKQNLTYEEISKAIKDKRIKTPLKNKLMTFAFQLNEAKYINFDSLTKEILNNLIETFEFILKPKKQISKKQKLKTKETKNKKIKNIKKPAVKNRIKSGKKNLKTKIKKDKKIKKRPKKKK